MLCEEMDTGLSYSRASSSLDSGGTGDKQRYIGFCSRADSGIQNELTTKTTLLSLDISEGKWSRKRAERASSGGNSSRSQPVQRFTQMRVRA